MRMNDTMTEFTMECVVNSRLATRPGEPVSDAKYIFGVRKYKDYMTRKGQLKSEQSYHNVFCFTEFTAKLARELRNNDRIVIHGEFINVPYIVDGKKYFLQEIKAERILLCYSEDELELD